MNEASSSELVRRPHALVLPTGAARSTSELVFDSAPLVWDDLPASTRHAARHRTPVIAERAVADGSLYRDGTGARVEVMRAWRAHRDRLYVAVASRRAPAPGVLDAAEPWAPVVLRRYDVVGEPRRRLGWVPPGVAPLPGGRGGAGTGGQAAPRIVSAPEHAAAAQAWPYLPEPVRLGAQRAVPLPEDWIGGLLQTWGTMRTPRSQDVTVLRRDAGTAVVLHATRELDAAPGVSADEHAAALASADWLVEQVVLSTAQPQQLTATRDVPPWI